MTTRAIRFFVVLAICLPTRITSFQNLHKSSLSFPETCKIRSTSGRPWHHCAHLSASFPTINSNCSNKHTALQLGQRRDDTNTGISSLDLGVTAAARTSYTASAIVLWSEIAVIQTGCGPLVLNDTVERTAYWVVLVIAGVCWFSRIIALGGGPSLAEVVADAFGRDVRNRIEVLLLISIELVSYMAVLGAVIALTTQSLSGAQMDGLSGINLEYCKSLQGFQENLVAP